MTTTTKRLYDMAEIQNGLSTIFLPGDIIEIRCLDVEGRPSNIRAGFFNDREKASKAIASMSGHCMGVYYILNQIDPQLFNRSANALKSAGQKDLTSDSHVTGRHFIPFDFDPKRLSGISSTDAEHTLALNVASEAHTYLINTLGFPANSILKADSGNGAHLLVRVAGIPLNKEGDDLTLDCLKGMAALFGTDKIDIDLKVFNRARIMKAYGSLACKGSNIPDRPWRISRLLSDSNRINAVATIDLLKKLAELKFQ